MLCLSFGRIGIPAIITKQQVTPPQSILLYLLFAFTTCSVVVRLEMFLVRILSCSHQMAVVDGSENRSVNEVTHSHALLRECVKLGCYLETDASMRLRGTEVRLPLEREDYVEVSIENVISYVISHE